MKIPAPRNIRFKLGLLAVLMNCFCVAAQAWDDDLIKLAYDFADKGGRISESQRAVLLARNRDLNLLAMSNQIDNATYQACQRDFVEFSEAIAMDSAKKTGVKLTVQQVKGASGRVQRDVNGQIRKKHPVYIPGTDSDYITGATTVDEVKDMKNAYNEGFQKKLKELGGNVPEGAVWTERSDVDFMADAEKTSKKEFELIALENNAAYKRPGAARFEANSRSANGVPNLADSSDYIEEMQDMVHHRETMIAKDTEELAKLLKNSKEEAGKYGTEAYRRAKTLEAEIYKNRAIQGKYIDRIDDANKSLRKLLPADSPLVLGSSKLGTTAKVRDVLSNPHDPLLLSSLKDGIINEQLRENAELLAALAKDPAKAAECQAAIIKLTANLPPQQKAQVIAAVREQLGNKAAQDLAMTLRGSKPAATMDAALNMVHASGADLERAAARADAASVRAAVAEMDDGMSRARGWANVADDAPNSLSSLNSSLAGMTDEELEVALQNNSALRSQIDEALHAAKFDADLLGAYAHTTDAKRRVALKGMLMEAAESPGVWGKLKSALSKANEIVKFDLLIGGVFAYWDALDAAQKSEEGDPDEAARKAFEAVLSAGAALPVSLMASLTNAMLGAAKEGGFGLAVSSQDAEDLLAGIISVKGWENAEGMQQSPETSIDKLASNCTTEGQIRSIVANLAAAAASGSDDTPAIRRGKEAALNAKCVDEVIRLWRARRTQMVMAYIGKLNRLQAQVEQMALEIRFDPSPVELTKEDEEAPVTIQALANPEALVELNQTLGEMKHAMRALAGRQQLADLRIRQKTIWTFDNHQTEETTTLSLDRFDPIPATKRVGVRKPGDYSAEVRIVWSIELINAIQGMGDFRAKTWNFNLSWNPLNWIKRGEKLTPGDPVNTYQDDMKRDLGTSGEGYLLVTLADDPGASPTPAPSSSPTPEPEASSTPDVESSITNSTGVDGAALQSTAPAEDGPTGLFDRFLNFFSTLQPVPPAPEVGNQTVSEKPGTMTKNLGKQPVKVPAKPTVSPAKRNEVPLPPPATPPAVKKAPEVIAPRPGMLPALKIPEEVVYGTSRIINETEALLSGGVSQDYNTVGKAGANAARDTTDTANPISPEMKLYKEQFAEYCAAWDAWKKEDDRRKEEVNAKIAAAKQKGETYVFSPLFEDGYEHPPNPTIEKPTWPGAAPASTPKPEPDGRRYFFKSTPDLRFEPVEATSPHSQVTFTRTGRVSIWMEIVDKDGKVVGETEVAEVNVVPPKFAIVLEPSSGAKVGQEVVATIEPTPPIPADLLDYRWLEPPTANRLEKTPNASQIVFKATAKPVTLQALARVPHYGDALGEVRQECSASAFTIAVTPVRRGPIPKEWSAEARGLVDVSRTFLIDEQFSLKAQLDGEGAPSAVRWRWTVNGGTTLSNPSVSEPTVSRHEPGEVSASVEALDSSGNLLGQAEISVRVVSEDEFLKPLAVIIKLDAPSVEVGKKAVARAEVTGGRPPYVLEWSPAGSGMQLELLPKEEGTQNIAVTVRDKRKKEARASATLKVEALPLEASVKADRSRALCGENVSLAASASGGTKPYRFRWTTPAKGQGEQGSLTSMKAESIEAGVEVTDAKGRTAQAKATVSFDPLSLTITGLQPKEKPGTTRTAKAGENLPQGITVKFRTSPSLPINASGKSAEIRFDKAGQYEVQAAAYATVEGVEQEVAKAPPVKVEVEAEPLQLVLEPTEISIGAEASARLVNSAGQPPEDVRADWTFAAGAGQTVSGTSAKLRPDAPGSFAVSVQWKDAASGKAAGQANATLAVKPLNLEIVVDPAGGDEFVLRISPGVKLPSGVAVNWTAAGADFVGPQQGSIIRVRLSSGARKSSVTATASNARSIEVGRAAASFEASEKPDPSQLAQKHIEKGYQEEQAGRLESACTEYEQALKLAPDPRVSSRLDALRQKLALARQEAERAAKTKELLAAGFRKESAGDLEGALADYEAAQKLTADARIDAHMRELRAKIAQAKTKQAPVAQAGTNSQDKSDKAQALLNEAFKKESAGDLSGAHESYVKALALKFDKRVWERVDALEKRIENSEKQAEKARTAKPVNAAESHADAPEAKKPAGANSLIAQKKAEVLRLSKEAMAIGNSMMSGNVNLADAQRNSQRIQQIQGQIQRLTAEINTLEAGR